MKTDHQSGIWRFQALLPLRDTQNAVSLGEGGTPLIRIPQLCHTVGLYNLYLKNESHNPTWSFKDRFNAINTSIARELGFTKIVSSSTGNHGASAAAYAAAAQLRCVVLVPQETPPLLRDLIQVYGARAIVTEWHGRGPLFEILVREHSWFPSSTFAPMPVGSPYGLEGYKTIAFELALQARQQPIDYVFVPVGGGDGLYGIYKGWREMLSLGLVDYLPHFVACQAVGANPVVRSFIERKKEVATVREAYSIATSTREETASDTALVALYESDGLAIDVTESEIIESIKLMATCGIFPEAASALSVACVRKAVATGCLPEGARVVAMITSAGIKWPAMLADLVEPSAVITPEFDTLREVIEID